MIKKIPPSTAHHHQYHLHGQQSKVSRFQKCALSKEQCTLNGCGKSREPHFSACDKYAKIDQVSNMHRE